MHDIWNPWHGCVKCSEGCQNCYMYFLDRVRDKSGSDIYKTKSGFDVDYRVDSSMEVATALKAKWDLNLKGGMVIANPIPAEFEMPKSVNISLLLLPT